MCTSIVCGLMTVALAQEISGGRAPNPREVFERLVRTPPDLTVLRGIGKDARYTAVIVQSFLAQTDRSSKLVLAREVARRGDPTGEVRTHLRKAVVDAIKSSGPDPFAYESSGAEIRGQFSPEFVAWSRRQGIAPEEQLAREIASVSEVSLLALMKDPESKSIFRAGLRAGMFVSQKCALGLGLLESEEDLGAIIDRLLSQRDEVSQGFFVQALSMYTTLEAKRQIEERLGPHPSIRAAYQRALADKASQGLRNAIPNLNPRR